MISIQTSLLCIVNCQPNIVQILRIFILNKNLQGQPYIVGNNNILCFMHVEFLLSTCVVLKAHAK
jgi:hypothetical protein